MNHYLAIAGVDERHAAPFLSPPLPFQPSTKLTKKVQANQLKNQSKTRSKYISGIPQQHSRYLAIVGVVRRHARQEVQVTPSPPPLLTLDSSPALSARLPTPRPTRREERGRGVLQNPRGYHVPHLPHLVAAAVVEVAVGVQFAVSFGSFFFLVFAEVSVGVEVAVSFGVEFFHLSKVAVGVEGAV